VSAYANKSGMSRDEIAAIMAAETWLTAEEAVEFGFADSIEAPVKMAARFDLSKFKNAPAEAGTNRKEPPMAKKDPVTFEALTLDQLKAERPDLAEAYQAEVKAQLEADAEAARLAAEEAAAAEAAANAGKETPEQIEARVRAAADARASEIAELCAKTGMTAKMKEFIASGKDVDAIARAILDERVLASGGDTNNRHGGGNGDKPAFPSTTDIYAHWNKAAH
jgi:ATP-dependent Clp protease, protease subunit